MKWMMLTTLMAGAPMAVAQIASSPIQAMQTALSDDEQDDDNSRDRFNLYTQCGKMDFNSTLSSLAEELGLTSASIDEVAVELLESANVYGDETSRAFASVNVTGSESGAYFTLLRFWKLVDDGTYTKTLGWAPTWTTVRLRTTPTSQTVLSDVADLVQYFVEEYLRVNDEACNPSTIPPTSAAECFSSSATSPSPVMGQTDEVITLIDGSKWEVGVGHFNYLYAYYPNVVVCPGEGIMLIRETVGDDATELRVTRL